MADEIPVIQGRPPTSDEPEYAEMMKYESGAAEASAAEVEGPHDEPWLNVRDLCEPAGPPAVDYALAHPAIGDRIKGRVIDLAAGTCWTTALLSRLDPVNEVVALDLSRHFLTTVGARLIRLLDGHVSKITFAVSSFNRLPFDDESFDCAFLVAAIHHSLSPIKTLLEARRVLKPGGMLIVVESPVALLGLEESRARMVQLSRDDGVTELCYTRMDHEYMLHHAGFDAVRRYPVDTLTRGPVRRLLRQALRIASLEDLLKPPTYVFVADK